MSTSLSRKLLFAMITASTIGCAEKAPTTPAEMLESSFSTGDWNTTIQLCNQLLEKNPNNAELITKRGQAHLATNNFEAAVVDFTRLIELRPDDANSYYYRESAYKGLGKDDLAYQDGQTGRERDPLYESAYAYDMSNFIPPVQLSSDPVPGDEGPDDRNESNENNDANRDQNPIADDSNNNDSVAENDDNRNSYDETVFSDETGFVPNETSRVLADAVPQVNLPNASAGDIGIPDAPGIAPQTQMPNLNMDAAGPVAPDADGGLADLTDIRFPANPTDDSPELEVPDTVIIPQQISTALPTDELGNIRLPSTVQTGLSTGLPTNLDIDNDDTPANISPSGLAIGNGGPISTGLNAPSMDLPRQAANPIVPTSPNVDPKFRNVPGLGGFNGRSPTRTGFSGFPLPNGSTGLPTGSARDANSTSGFTPNGPQFHSNPIYGPGNQPPISTNLQGYPDRNSVGAPNGSPTAGRTATGITPQPSISTSLPDTVLKNKLQGVSPTPLQLRSLQP